MGGEGGGAQLRAPPAALPCVTCAACCSRAGYLAPSRTHWGAADVGRPARCWAAVPCWSLCGICTTQFGLSQRNASISAAAAVLLDVCMCVSLAAHLFKVNSARGTQLCLHVSAFLLRKRMLIIIAWRIRARFALECHCQCVWLSVQHAVLMCFEHASWFFFFCKGGGRRTFLSKCADAICHFIVFVFLSNGVFKLIHLIPLLLFVLFLFFFFLPSSAFKMATILQKLLSPLFSGPPEPPRNKVTVVGVGQVGMACAVSILLRVRAPFCFHLRSD